MHHHRAWSLDRIVLFRDAIEALALWTIFTEAFPELIAICLMPDHVHLLLPHDDPGGRLADAESAYARWRNAHRGESGRVFAEHPPSRFVPPAEESRVIRYVLLNPCRRKLVSDPLAWPWSSHRDQLGLALRPVGPRASQPERFHKYVSSDKDVSRDGTPLPTPRWGEVSWIDVVTGVCSFARCDEAQLRTRGPARSMFVCVAWIFGLRGKELRRRTGLHRGSIWRLIRDLPEAGSRIGEPALAAAVAIVGDPRFSGVGAPRWPRR